MKILTSRQAAERLHVPISRFHRLVVEHDLAPVAQGSGLRGDKFWSSTDIDEVLTVLTAERREELERLQQVVAEAEAAS